MFRSDDKNWIRIEKTAKRSKGDSIGGGHHFGVTKEIDGGPLFSNLMNLLKGTLLFKIR